MRLKSVFYREFTVFTTFFKRFESFIFVGN